MIPPATDAFDILGIPRSSGRAEVRRAWRRLAKTLHPDVDGTPEAADAFYRARSAYIRAMAAVNRRGCAFASRGSGAMRSSSQPNAPSATPRPRLRFACPACEDTFDFPATCPRCELALVDSAQRPVPPHTDPNVDAFIEWLESPRPRPRFALSAERAESNLAASLFVLGAVQLSAGLVGLAVMSFGFATAPLLVAAAAQLRAGPFAA